MASGTADLQRDLGGAIMQSILGAVLTAGYAAADRRRRSPPRPTARRSPTRSQAELTKSFASAVDTAQQYPQYQDQIVAAAKTSFLQGDEWAYIAGIVAIVIGGAARVLPVPAQEREQELLAALPRGGRRAGERPAGRAAGDRTRDAVSAMIGHALAFAPRPATQRPGTARSRSGSRSARSAS